MIASVCIIPIFTHCALCLSCQVCDIYDLGKLPASAKNATVALEMDVPAFWAMMLEALEAADALSSLNSATKR